MYQEEIIGVNGELDEKQIEEAKKRYKITDKAQADWALRKIKKIEEEQKANTEFARNEIEKIKDWLEKENKTLQRSIDFFYSLLEEYFRKHVQPQIDKKSINLPNGTFGIRNGDQEFVYDDKKLSEWAKNSMPSVVKYTLSVDKNELKKVTEVINNKLVVKETGEVVEGVIVNDRPEKFYVKIR